jgi:hypothetical protein
VKYIFLLMFMGIGLAQWGHNVTTWGNRALIQQDAATHAIMTVDYEHHEVHSGSHYTFTMDSTVGDSDTLGFLIVTPNTTKWAHMVIEVDGALDTRFDLFESSTHTTGGERTAYNNNRNSANTNTTTIHNWTRGVSDGTNIFRSHFGIDSGVGAGRVTGGGGTRGATEWILKQNTKYFAAIISATAANVVSLKFTWYEHTDKE